MSLSPVQAWVEGPNIYLGPHTSVSGRTLFCRCCGFGARIALCFALRRGGGAGGGMGGGGGAFVLMPTTFFVTPQF